MKQIKKVAIVSLFSISLMGCATPYKASGIMGGYSDMKLSQDMYRVNFGGNGWCGHGRTQKFLLYRCAELAYKEGYPYFIIIGSNSSDDVSYFTTPATVSTTGQANYNYWSGATYNSHSVINPAQTFATSKPNDSVLIKLLRSNKGYPTAIETNIIVQEMRNERIVVGGRNG